MDRVAKPTHYGRGKMFCVCGRVWVTSYISSGVGSWGCVRLSQDSQWVATRRLLAWSSRGLHVGKEATEPSLSWGSSKVRTR